MIEISIKISINIPSCYSNIKTLDLIVFNISRLFKRSMSTFANLSYLISWLQRIIFIKALKLVLLNEVSKRSKF